MRGRPPSKEGEAHCNSTLFPPTVVERFSGTPGAAYMRILLDGAEAILDPTAFLACTVKEYIAPGVRPVMVIGEVDPVAVIFPGVEVTI